MSDNTSHFKSPWCRERASQSKNLTQTQAGIKHGWRSGLEEKIGAQLSAQGIPFEFESLEIPFTQPAKERHYTPDFLLLNNGIIIETKGEFTKEDRDKHLWVRQAHPELDIRFVFQNANGKIAKGSPTSYAKWCDKNGFKWAHKTIPQAWLQEEEDYAATFSPTLRKKTTH